MGRKNGFKCSPETIQKMKESRRKYWDKKKEIFIVQKIGKEVETV